MKPKQFFVYCPKCGGDLAPTEGNFSVCTKCGFKLFHNVSACVSVILENEQGEVVLAQRARDPGKGEWDLPGGFIEPGEEADIAAKREINEELGVELTDLKLLCTHPDTYLYQGLNIDLMNIFFVGKIGSGELKPADDVADFKFVSKQDLLNHKLWCPSLKLAVEDYLKSVKPPVG